MNVKYIILGCSLLEPVKNIGSIAYTTKFNDNSMKVLDANGYILNVNIETSHRFPSILGKLIVLFFDKYLPNSFCLDGTNGLESLVE